MTDCPHNIDLFSLLRRETVPNRSSLPSLPAKIVEKPRQQNNAWCIVATDGSTSIICCKSGFNAPETNTLDQVSDQDNPTELDNRTDDMPDFREVGVDLSYLNVQKDTAAKLIAGMQAMSADEPMSSLRRAIAMPKAVTDLQEIFKTDNTCIVSPPKTVSKRVCPLLPAP